MEIDTLDRRILYEMDCNARQSISSLAKKLRINRNVALYRLNRLKKEGIIKYAFAEVNSIALGYYTFRIFLKLGNCTPKDRNNLETFILSQKNLTWFSKVIGTWDLDTLYATKNVAEFDIFRKDLFLRFNQLIEDYNIALLSSIYCYPKDYLVSGKREHVVPKVFTNGVYQADRKDQEIMHLLTKDATIGIVELSQQVHLSVNTVIKRLRNLERENIILNYRLFIDTNKLGYQYFKLHLYLRNYTSQDISNFRHFLETKSFMIYTDHYINGADFEVELHLKSEQEYLSFLEELISRFGRIIKNHVLIKFYEELLFRYLPEK